jgi:hypothetical protein
LNFTLIDPAIPVGTTDAKLVETSCEGAGAAQNGR